MSLAVHITQLQSKKTFSAIGPHLKILKFEAARMKTAAIHCKMHGCEDGLALVQVTTRGGHTEQPDKDQKSRQMFWEKDQDIATHDRSRNIKIGQ
jgi:hypothetical protein